MTAEGEEGLQIRPVSPWIRHPCRGEGMHRGERREDRAEVTAGLEWVRT